MIGKYNDERELRFIAGSPALEQSIASFNLTKRRIVVIRDKPMRINTEDIKSDMRYNLGYIAALEWVLKQPEEAQDYLIDLEKGV